MFRQPGQNGKLFTLRQPSTLHNSAVRLLPQPYLKTLSLLLRASLWKDFSADPAALQIRYFPLFLTLTFIILWPETTVLWTAWATTGVCHFLKLLSPLGGVISGAFQSPGRKKASAISCQAQITTAVAKARRIVCLQAFIPQVPSVCLSLGLISSC